MPQVTYKLYHIITNLSKAEKDRLKKKERKERSKRRKLNLPEDEPVNDKKDKMTKKQKESTSLPYKVSNLIGI
jgi:hypothetical protein